MARKANPTSLPEVIEADEEQIRSDLQAADQLALATQQHDSHVRLIAQQLGYQLPAECTDPDLIQRDIAANMRRSIEACLEVGRGLRVLKEACQHGQFMARLEVLGIEASVAQRFMQAATKFSNAASTQHLLKAAGNQTKLFELLILDDEQVKELELTGQTGELKLDEIATMSVKELRTALRESKATLAAKDKVIRDKSERLDSMASDLELLKTGGTDQAARLAAERELVASKNLQDAALALLGYVNRYKTVLADLLTEPTEARETLGHETTRWIFQQLAAITAEHNWMVDFQDTVAPAWVEGLDLGTAKG